MLSIIFLGFLQANTSCDSRKAVGHSGTSGLGWIPAEITVGSRGEYLASLCLSVPTHEMWIIIISPRWVVMRIQFDNLCRVLRHWVEHSQTEIRFERQQNNYCLGENEVSFLTTWQVLMEPCWTVGAVQDAEDTSGTVWTSFSGFTV